MKYRYLLPLIVVILLFGSLVEPAQAAATFTLEFPTDVRPAQVVRKFIKPKPGNTAHEGIDILAPVGASVFAGASGKVKKVVLAEDGRGWGAYVMIVTRVNNVKYKVSYANLKNITVQVDQEVASGAKIAESAGAAIKIVIQSKQGGMSGFKVNNVVSPKPFLRLTEMRLRPIDNNLRLRALPTTDSEVLGQVSQWDLLKTPELAYNAMRTTGKEDKWLRVTMNDNTTAYVSAFYVKVVSLDDPVEGIPGIPIKGMNLDYYNALGTPPAEPLENLGWVRINYIVSYNPDNGTYGNVDLEAAYDRYEPIIRRYAENGNKVIVILTHQFYGEGQGYVWEQMTPQLWQELTATYAAMANQVAAQYAGDDLVYAYQIWNEQDTLPGNGVAAVPIPAQDYAYLLAETIQAIEAGDPDVNIITGGHISGTSLGVAYAQQVLNQLPDDVQPDGIAFHPYGVGPVGSPFNVFGTIDVAIEAWSNAMPNTPMWITEWGVLDYQHDDSVTPAITEHAQGFMDVIEQEYPGMIAAAVWYAWADGMDNGFGMVDENNLPKQPLYDVYLGFNQRFSVLTYRNENPGGLIPLPPPPTQANQVESSLQQRG